MILAFSGDQAVAMLTKGQEHAWSTEKILTLSAGILLALYGVKLTCEQFFEEGDDKDTHDDKDTQGEPLNDMESYGSDASEHNGLNKFNLHDDCNDEEHGLPKLLSRETFKGGSG